MELLFYLVSKFVAEQVCRFLSRFAHCLKPEIGHWKAESVCPWKPGLNCHIKMRTNCSRTLFRWRKPWDKLNISRLLAHAWKRYSYHNCWLSKNRWREYWQSYRKKCSSLPVSLTLNDFKRQYNFSPIMQAISRVCMRSILLIVSNPVEAMTYVAWKLRNIFSI